MLAESGIRLADVVEKVGVEVCYDVSFACRSRFWTCESVTVVWCKRVCVSWCGGGTVLLMMWAERDV